MSNNKHKYEGRKPRVRQGYIAIVEGEDRGVPFRTFYKRIGAAEYDAIKTGGTIINPYTLVRRRWVNNEWREA